MLIVKQDKNRPYSEGQVFIELTKNRGLSVTDCDRLGYWCDKEHLRHFMLELSMLFSVEELKELLKLK